MFFAGAGAGSEERVAKRQKRSTREPLILNMFLQGCVNSQPSGLWSYTGDISTNYNKLSFWTDLARKAEDAKFNSIFIADVLGSYDVYKGPGNFKTGVKAGVQHPGIAPDTAVPAMAAVTKNLGFGITFSTISEHPYHFARRLGSLDHLTDGRVGWNIVSSYLDSASRNLLDGVAIPERSERYKKTEEYVQVVSELLLSSFRSDALKADPKTKTYIDPELARNINFKGKYFTVPGPGYTEPSPQGIPVLFEAGTSPGGMELAAKTAEVVFCNGSTPAKLRAKVETIKGIAKDKYNRDPNSIKVISLVMVIVGTTREEALEKFEKLADQADPEGALALIGGWLNIDYSQYDDEVDLLQIENTVHREVVRHFCGTILDQGPINKAKFARHASVKGSTDLVIGSVQEVCDQLEEWIDVAGTDGFNFAAATNPGTFDDLIELVLPELRRRGLAWDDYPIQGGTLRENVYGVKGRTFLPEEHPYHGYRWTEGTNEEFTEKFTAYKDDLLTKQGDANK
jgi:FMN-dependent oxidoreductase (nitrilotriacetate monooxygenase family)